MLMRRGEEGRVSCQKTTHHSPRLITSSSSERFFIITCKYIQIQRNTNYQSNPIYLYIVAFHVLVIIFQIVINQWNKKNTFKSIDQSQLQYLNRKIKSERSLEVYPID